LSRAFAKNCDRVPLRSLAIFVTSGSRGWAKYYAADGPLFLRVGDVRRRNIELDLTEVQRVQPPDGAEGARTAVHPGDILITITADLGRVGVIPDNLGPGFVNQHVALVRLVEPSLARWV